MTFEIKRNPRVLAGEILEKLGAVDLTQCDGVIGSTAQNVLTIYSAIKGALEQIKFGKIPAMHVGMLDVTKELSDALASIQETCQNNIFEFHSLEVNATEEKTPEIIAQRKKAENMYDATRKALTTFSAIFPLIAEQLIDYSPQQEWKKGKGKAFGALTLR
jgi:hypothetical protein